MLLQVLYLRGGSTGDFQEALVVLLGKDAPTCRLWRSRGRRRSGRRITTPGAMRYLRAAIRVCVVGGVLSSKNESRRAMYAVPPSDQNGNVLMGVMSGMSSIQRMKTKRGSCNHRTGSIRLNTDLARKPRNCLEYIVVHEMAHLLESTHNGRFMALMDKFMSKWQSGR